MHIPLLTGAYINAACPLQFKPLALILATNAISPAICVRDDTNPISKMAAGFFRKLFTVLMVGTEALTAKRGPI
jgi:hypothetical protein